MKKKVILSFTIFIFKEERRKVLERSKIRTGPCAARIVVSTVQKIMKRNLVQPESFKEQLSGLERERPMDRTIPSRRIRPKPIQNSPSQNFNTLKWMFSIKLLQIYLCWILGKSCRRYFSSVGFHLHVFRASKTKSFILKQHTHSGSSCIPLSMGPSCYRELGHPDTDLKAKIFTYDLFYVAFYTSGKN